MPWWLREPLSEAGLQNIRNHRYVAGSYTPLDNLLNPWWTRATDFLPMWMAPNLVTLLGLMFMIFSYCLIWFYSPCYIEVPPRWVFFVSALCLFVYQTLDAMDGKQARRTGSSSPLGQLFDHGCDCLCTLAHHTLMCAILVPGSTPYCQAVLATLQSGFYLAQLQEMFTGILPTSSGDIGVTELQYGLIFASLAAAALGPELLSSIMHCSIDLPLFGQVTLANSLIIIWCGFSWAMSAISLTTVIEHLLHQKRNSDIGKLLAYTSPVLLLSVLFFSWAPEFLAAHCRLVCFSTGLLFFYYTAQVVLFSMAHAPFPFLQLTLVPYGILAYVSRAASADGYLQPSTVRDMLIGFSVFLFFSILNWLVSVMVHIKRKLGIYAFSLKRNTDYISIAVGG